jgi:YbgC/YbaW family acyl-CoA thioester hydrolase
MPATFRTTRRVEFSDTDMAGIVHFSRFFCYMESAEHELLRSLGLSVFLDWEGQRISFPRVGASCDFLKPVRFEDVLTIDATVENVGRTSVTYGFKFFKGEEAIAVGQLTAVCCRVGTEHGIEAIEIPPGIRSRLEQCGAFVQ